MGHGPQCPCKFRLGIEGNSAPADVVVVDPNNNETTFSGTINFSSEQCFNGAPKCNPNVNNFKIAFADNSTKPAKTINFTQGRRGTIACIDQTDAFLSNGTAQAKGNVLSGTFTVNFSYSINTMTNTATITIMATGEDGTTFDTTFTAQISSETFIGACTDTVG